MSATADTDPSPTPGDFLNAESACSFLAENLALEFKANDGAPPMTTASTTDVTGVASSALFGLRPYHEEAAVTIYHGDCRQIVPLLGRFDLLLTDPPYGIDADNRKRILSRGKLAAAKDDSLPLEVFFFKLQPVKSISLAPGL